MKRPDLMIERYIAMWTAVTGRAFVEYTLAVEGGAFVFRRTSDGGVDSVMTSDQFLAHGRRLKEMPSK